MFDKMISHMQKVLLLVEDDLKLIKTGRAKPSLVEHVKVEAYEGQVMPLIELASITAPDPHTLLISPWDKTIVDKVYKTLSAGEQSLNPVIDGDLIRISVPPLTQERREELVKLVKQRLEAGRQMLRQLRNDTKKDIDAMEGEPGVSEDDVKRYLDDMQKKFDEFLVKLEDLGKTKEKELMEL
ncbi:ribosome recycling factor [Microgenomates group bacterium RIFCSPLOWO2_01_FULL_46_13]|nr:MAG: ribosome recycling factor [Microgenomates group bacterium RIFCSPHIGHO2_01_FULL_45_11]OGV94868.1 MAG: ribosome recycling factor [Microgenomates group bacterium RIFCSPLOWO2_01_FULL_46_13]